MKRMISKAVLLSMVVAVLVGAHPASAQLSITDLGTLPGGDSFDSSTASGINDRGQIVGQSDTPSFELHAFLWEDGKMSDLGTLPSGGFSEAEAINNLGQVVGQGDVASGAGHHAFLWEKGKMTDLGTLPGSSLSNALDINDRGQVVGSSTLASDSAPEHAVLWTK